MAIFKPKVWHPGTKHGSTKQEETPITKNMDSLLRFASLLFIYGSVSFRSTIFRYGMTNRIVKDCRVGRNRALLAMTNRVGFAGKRNNFRNETIESGTVFGTKRLKNDAGQHRAKRPHKRKTSVFQIKPSRFRVIARPQRGRGNLKVEGVASRDEAREWEARRQPYRKNMRFAASFRFLFLHYFMVLLHSLQPYFVTG